MTAATVERLRELVDRLRLRDRDAHEDALASLAAEGDERVIPHLVDVLVIDAIANDWERFGFPEAMRSRDPPRYLELPDVRWPGVRETLSTLAEPSFDSDYAWVEWETWYSQREIDPLPGYREWKRSLYASFLPPVGGLLDTSPIEFDLRDLRWGNCDRSFLAALNEPTLVPGADVEVDPDADRPVSGDRFPTDEREPYLKPDDLVFGFEVGETAVAVPRWLLFPHELLNVTVADVPVSLTFCTLCNAPILYDREIDGETHTFGSSGLLLHGNKVMYDEETETLWSQHRGEPIAGPLVERDATLSVRPVSQTSWESWREQHPDSLVPSISTGYGYDYYQYEGDLGIFRHYWEGEAVQPGVATSSEGFDEKASVYGVTDGDSVVAFPVDAVRERGSLVATFQGNDLLALPTEVGDVAVYDAPPTPVRVEDGRLRDATGTVWERTPDGLVAGSRTLDPVPGRHGLWFAFRLQYEDATIAET